MRLRARSFLVAWLAIACVRLAGAASPRCPEVDLPPGFDPESKASLRAVMPDLPTIFLAGHSGHGRAMARLLAAGASPNVCVLGKNMLSFATADLADLQVMLGHGADPNAPLNANGGTPLAYAIFFGRFDSADALLAHGADPLVVSDEGETPLHALNVPELIGSPRAHARQLALGRRLLDAGVPVDARLVESGATALMQAALHGDEAMVRLLLDRGADPAACSASGQCVLDLARRSGNKATVARVRAALDR